MSVKVKKILVSFFVVLAVLFVGAAGYFYYFRDALFNPQSDTVKNEVTAVVDNNEFITFDNDKNKIINHDAIIRFSAPVAKISEINKVIRQGVAIKPELKGVFKWTAADVMVFSPEEYYKPGTTYVISFDDKLFNDTVIWKKSELKLKTPDIAASIEQNSVVEDVLNVKNKKAVAVMSFIFPIDKNSMSEKLDVQSDGKKIDYDLSWNDNYTKAYLSMPAEIKEKAQIINVKAVDVKAKDFDYKIQPISFAINIPSQSDYFKITDMSAMLVRDEKDNNRPNQILKLEFSSAVKVSDVASRTQILGIKYNNGKKVLDKEVPFSVIPTADEYSNVVMFKYKPKYYGQIRVNVAAKGLRSRDNYRIDMDMVRDFYVPTYPKELNIGFDGAVMTSRGDKYLSFESRGLRKIEIEIARIKDDQINNLVSQSNGNFKNFAFSNYNFDQYNIAEIHKETLSLASRDPEEINYSSIQLSKFVGGKTGVFLITAKGYSNHNYYDVETKRLVLLTDLGLLTKHDNNGKTDVFVSSIKDGGPVEGAKVSIIGKNGVPVLEKVTDKDGHVSFANVNNFTFEKYPVAVEARLNGDMSYIPYDNYANRLNFSKFSVGGDYDYGNTNRVKADIFSDRGIYRPGEKINFGVVFRTADMNTPAKLPVNISVSDPTGKQIFDQTINIGASGLSSFSTDLSKTAISGNYVIRIRTKDYYFVAEKTLKVADFVPDRMKMSVDFNGTVKKGWQVGRSLPFRAVLTNLFGTPAAQRKITSDLFIAPKKLSFDEYKGYSFNHGLVDADNNDAKKMSLGEKQTDDKGVVDYNVDASSYQNGMYEITVSAEGYEPDGGRSVGASTRVIYSPLPYMVGFKADGGINYIKKNTKRKIGFIAIDNDLSRVSLADLALKTEKLEKVSSLVKDKTGIYRYQTINKRQLVSEDDWYISDDAESAKMIDTSSPGNYRLSLTEKKTDKLLADIVYTVVGEEKHDSGDKTAEIELKLDKEEYNNGEEIKAALTVPYTGYGIISVESSKLHSYKWFKTDQKHTTLNITVPADVKGNAYVNVAFVRDFGSKEIFMSPLSYAVEPFRVNRKKYQLNVDMQITDEFGGKKEVFEPGETINIHYKAGEKAKIIVYGADEGILQLTGYKLPGLLDTFLAKKALSVNTSQILDLIIPDFSKIKEYSHIGGDTDENGGTLQSNHNPFPRKNDKSVVFWSKVMDADTDEKVYSYTLPDTFNGSMRIMAVVSAANGVKTSAVAKRIKSRGSFIAMPNVPLAVSPGDKFNVSVGLTNLKDNADDFTVELSTDEKIGVNGQNKQQVTIQQNKEKLVEFNISALDKIGSASLTFNVSDSKGKKQKVTSSLSVRPISPYLTSVVSGYAKGKLKVKDIKIPMYDNLASFKVTAGKSPLILLTGLDDYLKSFSFDCTEQITSKIFALIAREPDGEKKYQKEFNEYISDLSSRQLPNGGFALYPYGSNAAKFPSMYVLHFLLHAQKKGYVINSGMLSNLKSWAISEINADDVSSLYDAKIKAYGIYLLTLSGEVTTSYVLSLHSKLDAQFKDWNSSFISVLMASTYKMLGDADKANAMIKDYDPDKKTEDTEIFYGENVSDYAFYIYLRSSVFNDKMFDNKVVIERLLAPVMNHDYNTLSALYSVLALSSVGENEAQEINLKILDGKGEIIKAETEKAVSLEFDLTGKNAVSMVSDTEGLYYVINNSGFPLKISSSESKGIEIVREYQIDGRKTDKVKIGENIDVVLRIRSKNGKDNYNLALIDLYTGGFEYVSDSFTGDIDYTDIKDDRLIAYLSVGNAEVKELRYKVKATSKGKFAVPPSELKSLYNPYLRSIYRGEEFFTVE